VLVNSERARRLCNESLDSDDNPRVLRMFKDLCKKHNPDTIILPTGYGEKTWTKPFDGEFIKKLVSIVGVVFQTYEEGAEINRESLTEPEFTHQALQRSWLTGMFAEVDFCRWQVYRDARIKQIHDVIAVKLNAVEIYADWYVRPQLEFLLKNQESVWWYKAERSLFFNNKNLIKYLTFL